MRRDATLRSELHVELGIFPPANFVLIPAPSGGFSLLFLCSFVFIFCRFCFLSSPTVKTRETSAASKVKARKLPCLKKSKLYSCAEPYKKGTKLCAFKIQSIMFCSVLFSFSIWVKLSTYIITCGHKNLHNFPVNYSQDRRGSVDRSSQSSIVNTHWVS